jgi:tRNA(Ile2) C34 agmatinyltransferase TiaS
MASSEYAACQTFGCGQTGIRRGEKCPKCGAVRPENDEKKVSHRLLLSNQRLMLLTDYPFQ